jgi:hypothetical protein
MRKRLKIDCIFKKCKIIDTSEDKTKKTKLSPAVIKTQPREYVYISGGLAPRILSLDDEAA